MRGGAEYDAFGKFGRKYLCYIGRPGVRKGIKRQFNRRERLHLRLKLKVEGE